MHVGGLKYDAEERRYLKKCKKGSGEYRGRGLVLEE